MSESNYQEVFQAITTNLVPKVQYEKSQLEVGHLKEELRNVVEELKSIKLKYEEQKLTIEILQAEKESLQAEKKTFEVKVKEVSLKLKQKTYQYESQMTTSNTPSNAECAIEKISTGCQTVKKEPPEIGVVNVPASDSSTTASKRTHSKYRLNKLGNKYRMKYFLYRIRNHILNVFRIQSKYLKIRIFDNGFIYSKLCCHLNYSEMTNPFLIAFI